MSNLNLKENPTLKDIQDYVQQMEEERGFDHISAHKTYLLLVEEIGELAKVLRKHDDDM